jgi:hypothetical protein
MRANYSFIIALLVGSLGCRNHKDRVILQEANARDIKLEVDTAFYPEFASFPILLKITNYTQQKAILFFDTISEGNNRCRTKNLYLICDKDTFSLCFNGTYLVLNENSLTSYITCNANYGGSSDKDFQSFGEIDSVLSSAKIEYHFNGIIPAQINQQKLNAIADTFLAPSLLEADTRTIKILNDVQHTYHEVKSEKPSNSLSHGK